MDSYDYVMYGKVSRTLLLQWWLAKAGCVVIHVFCPTAMQKTDGHYCSSDGAWTFQCLNALSYKTSDQTATSNNHQHPHGTENAVNLHMHALGRGTVITQIVFV